MIRPDFRNFVNSTVAYKADVISHSAKGSSWKDHKYIRKEGDRYIYPDKVTSHTTKDGYTMEVYEYDMDIEDLYTLYGDDPEKFAEVATQYYNKLLEEYEEEQKKQRKQEKKNAFYDSRYSPTKEKRDKEEQEKKNAFYNARYSSSKKAAEDFYNSRHSSSKKAADEERRKKNSFYNSRYSSR